MDDAELNRLLGLVDEPAPEPVDFKATLRAELDETLQRDARAVRHSTGSGELHLSEAQPDRAPQRWPRVIGIAASLIIVVAGLALLTSNRAGDDPAVSSDPTADGPTSAPAASSVATSTPVTSQPTIESICATYRSAAAPLADLELLAATTATVPPDEAESDLSATATALDELRKELVDGVLIDETAALPLQLAAGALRQAATQLDTGDTGAAGNSIRSAVQQLQNLSDPPDPVSLDGCGFE